MSGLSFDHVCDPTSMFQDSFSLSEFILGQQDDDSMESSEIIKEEIDSEEEFHEQITAPGAYQDGRMQVAYSPCSYTARPPTFPGSPASSSSGCSGSSPTGYQPPPMSYGTERCGPPRYLNQPVTERTLQYAVYMGYRSRERKRDEELPEEEREKRKLRRERNKLAALRCRTRRRERIETLEKETAELEEQNNEVENEITSLQAQLKQLEQMLKDHHCPHGIMD